MKIFANMHLLSFNFYLQFFLSGANGCKEDIAIFIYHIDILLQRYSQEDMFVQRKFVTYNYRIALICPRIYACI